MKTLFLLLALSGASSAYAASGQYVSKESYTEDPATMLNSLKCDTSKPYTTVKEDNGWWVVTCVQK